MRRRILTLFLVLISVSAWGQRKIQNSLTTDYQNIKGTKVSLITPKWFTEGENFPGLQHADSGSSIMILDIPGPFSETSLGITKENLLSKGIKVKKIENLIINDLPAIFATGTQIAYGNIYTKYILLIGTEEETILLNAVFPEKAKKIGDKLKKSMLTVRYDPDLILDPFASVDYTINISDTKLKFAKSMSNSLLFTVDGLIPTASDDKTNLVVTQSFSPLTQQDKESFSLTILNQTSIEIENIEYNEEIYIDGLKGYEILANGKNKKSGSTENIYQVILFSEELYYILFGTTNDETDESIAEIRSAVLSFIRK